MHSAKRRANIAAVFVRLVLWILSFVGWTVQLAGVGMVAKSIVNANDDEQQFSEMKLYVISPFLLCLVSAVPLYLLNLIHIIVHYKNKNWGHPVHSIMMCYFLPFIAGASTGIFVALIYAFSKLSDFITGFVHLDVYTMKILMVGAIISLVCQWIGSFIWQPFNYERHPHRLEYQELEESTKFS